jgi:beta-glucanase (GH16 family)
MLPRRLSAPLAIALLILGLVGGALPALATAGARRTGAHTARIHRSVRHRSVRHRHATRRAVSALQPLRAVNAAASGTPSGVAMPTGDIPGWHQVFADDFTGSALDSSKWRLYWGQPGGDPGGWFDPAHVSVSGGQMVLAGYRDPADGGKWATAGVSSSPGLVQTYGKYLVRFRFDSGVGIAHAILLWPGDNSWPPEIDFSEDNGANRQTAYATLHYGANNTQVQRKVAVDLTQWHTLGVEWTPGRLVYTLDGQAWSTVTSSHVPSVPMTLDIQTQAWACGTSTWEQCPNATTPAHVNLYVDWVVAYAPS